GAFPMTSVIISMGIALGGIAQIIAGILEFKNKNTFAGTAFVAYGCFWFSLVMIVTWQESPLIESNAAMGAYLLVWGAFTIFMFIATLKHNMISKIVFGSLAVLFILLGIGDLAESEVITTIAGVVGIICGTSAIYSAVGQIINEEFGKKVFPLI
ncbi:acetate uptake transporter, partial [Acholeplasma sp. OttesenSCG-928-E16]|nr:acetate uptake transporter [Acholeplasma sp. OttesenSCG-928-E16]